MRRTRVLGRSMLLLLALATPAAAQVPWDGTMLLAPGSPGGPGVFLFDPGSGGLGVLGTWRQAEAPAGFGVRAGVGEDALDQVAVLAGLDLAGMLLRPTDDLPMGVIWLLGAGISVGDEVLASFPVGLSFGTDLQAEGILFRPYVTPRVALDIWSGPGDQLDLSAAADLGLDVAFAPSWVIRFAASIGDREAIAVGVTFPGVSLR